jgi:hypothetical protein
MVKNMLTKIALAARKANFFLNGSLLNKVEG